MVNFIDFFVIVSSFIGCQVSLVGNVIDFLYFNVLIGGIYLSYMFIVINVDGEIMIFEVCFIFQELGVEFIFGNYKVWIGLVQ